MHSRGARDNFFAERVLMNRAQRNKAQTFQEETNVTKKGISIFSVVVSISIIYLAFAVAGVAYLPSGSKSSESNCRSRAVRVCLVTGNSERAGLNARLPSVFGVDLTRFA